MTRRLLGGTDIHLDANRINARQGIDAINRLEGWWKNGVIYMTMCETAQREAAAGRDARRTAKAMGQPAWLSLATSPEEVAQLRDIESVLFPGGASTPNQRNDVDIVFCAGKYHATLVTNDGGSKSQPGGILGNRRSLAQLGVRVMTAEEAVQRVLHLILHRDVGAIECWKVMGEPLPEWLGHDAPEHADEIRRRVAAHSAIA